MTVVAEPEQDQDESQQPGTELAVPASAEVDSASRIARIKELDQEAVTTEADAVRLQAELDRLSGERDVVREELTELNKKVQTANSLTRRRDEAAKALRWQIAELVTAEVDSGTWRNQTQLATALGWTQPQVSKYAAAWRYSDHSMTVTEAASLAAAETAGATQQAILEALSQMATAATVTELASATAIHRNTVASALVAMVNSDQVIKEIEDGTARYHLPVPSIPSSQPANTRQADELPPLPLDPETEAIINSKPVPDVLPQNQDQNGQGASDSVKSAVIRSDMTVSAIVGELTRVLDGALKPVIYGLAREAGMKV